MVCKRVGLAIIREHLPGLETLKDETNLRSYSRRPGCSRPVRWACACRAGGRARFRASRHHGLRPDPRRLWATTVAVLALVGVVIGGLALARPASRFGTASGRLGAIVALVAGLIAVINGALVLAIANGGPGTGNGVVGGAGALVLGLIALALGGLALARSRRTG
jgi:Family of unknown function (DUF6223)